MRQEMESYICFGVKLKEDDYHHTEEWIEFRYINFHNIVNDYFNTVTPPIRLLDYNTLNNTKYILYLTVTLNIFNKPNGFNFNPQMLRTYNKNAEARLINFCDEFNFEYEGMPDWCCVSYYS